MRPPSWTGAAVPEAWSGGGPTRGDASRDLGHVRRQRLPAAAAAARRVVAVLLSAKGAIGGATIDVGPELADGAWANVVASAPANCTIRFSAGSYRAGARGSGCNVTLPLNSRLEAAPGEVVVIDCQGSGRRHFIVPKGSRSVMEGLTLVNGSSQGDAGCVLVEANASLQIHHSVLSNCRASQRGGGVYVSKGGRVSAWDSVFETCVANADGGGVYASESSLLLERSSMRFCFANR